MLMSLIILFIVGFAGAFVHFLKQNWDGKINKADAIAFGEWLATKSPVKSISMWVLLAGGILVAYLFLGIRYGLIGSVLSFLYGYFLDSLLKRYGPKIVGSSV